MSDVQGDPEPSPREALRRFLVAHRFDDDSLAVVIHGGSRGLVSDRDGYLLTLSDLRAIDGGL